MDIEKIKAQIAEVEKKFAENEGIIKTLKNKESQVFIENTRLQGEYRLLEKMLNDLEPKQ